MEAENSAEKEQEEIIGISITHDEPKNKTARQMEVIKRKELAIKLRLDGYTYRQIADIMFAMEAKSKVRLPASYDERYAYRDVSAVIDEVRQNLVESGEILRIIELKNLDRLQNAIINRALDGDLKAIDRIIAIMKQREKYVPDLTQPKKVDVKTWQSEIIDLIKENKITIEDVRDVYPQFAEKLMDEFAQPRSAGELGDGSSAIEGEFINLGQVDEDVSRESSEQ